MEFFYSILYIMHLDFSKFARFENKNKEIIEGILYKKKYIYPFISFNTFSNNHVEIKNSFKRVRCDSEWIKEYKCDASKTILKPDNKFFDEIKRKNIGSKIYFTLYDGREKYLIYRKNNRINIYEKSEKYYFDSRYSIQKPNRTLWMYTKHLGEFNAKKIFIGKDNATPEFSGRNFYGNSILLKIDRGKYMFVGHEIYNFEIPMCDEIIDFVSPIGKNMFSYPVAMGNKCLYFMLSKTYVYKATIKQPQDSEHDLYHHYFTDWEKKAKKLIVI